MADQLMISIMYASGDTLLIDPAFINRNTLIDKSLTNSSIEKINNIVCNKNSLRPWINPIEEFPYYVYDINQNMDKLFLNRLITEPKNAL